MPSMAAKMRFLSSCLEATRIWRSTERASFEKKPSTRLSQEPCFGVKTKMKRSFGLRREPRLGLFGYVGGIIVEDQLDRGRSRIGRIEKLQKLNELAGAVAFLDEAMDLASHEIDPGKQAQRSVALILMISGESCMNAGFRRQVRRGRANRLHARLLVEEIIARLPLGFRRRGAGCLRISTSL